MTWPVNVLIVCLMLVATYAYLLNRERDFRQAILKRILARVSGRFEPSKSPWADRMTGDLHGRPFRLELRSPFLLLHQGKFPMRAGVELSHAPDLRLRIRRDAGKAALEKALGLVRDVEVAGGDRFDAKYVVEADDAPAQTPLADPDIREAIHKLIAHWDLDEVALESGWLVAVGQSRRLGQKMLHEMLYELQVLAHAYDRRPALEIGIQERFVWVGGVDAAPRCPFCHDGVSQSDDLSSCGHCGTVIHTECHRENRGCPILGCGGQGAEPVGPLKLKEN